MNITMDSFHYSKRNPPVCRFLTQIRVINTVKPHWDYNIILVKLLSSIHPSILNRTFRNSRIEFDWVRQSNEIEHRTLCEKSNPTEPNTSDCVRLSFATKLSRTLSNELSLIGFDCPIFLCESDFVRLLNAIDPMDWVGLSSIEFNWVQLTMPVSQQMWTPRSKFASGFGL